MPASLLTLPVELVEHIVLLAIPPDEAVSQYKDRQITLVSLCKTCKKLFQVAQPVLWRVLVPKRAEHVHIETWSVTVRKQDWVSFSSSQLTKLTLINVGISRGNLRSISFPHLLSLTFCASGRQPKSLFSPSSLSSVQAIATKASWTGTGFSSITDFSKLPRLHTLQLKAANTGMPSASSSLGYEILVAFNLGDLHGGTLSRYWGCRHMQLNAALHSYPGGRIEPLLLESHEHQLNYLIDFIKTAPTLLSFSLPLAFHPSTCLPLDRQHRRDKLVKALEDRDVKIIWRLNSREAADDVEVSREFWRYAKELKARKALEAAEATASSSA